ncbi:diguanylate cyclase domain-containing protein [Rhodococcus qingshengii]|uniref:diguanylate cyclase domain-containing protein n=1 Tax=Rhodococcus qingshengii TaxID=334542 RepID=UPI00237C64E8|nr:diguanylate cyclase [Rhodococcus qingshengii]WCT06003.1 diguanylate cyclase [Rhodococcus qingshengii]
MTSRIHQSLDLNATLTAITQGVVDCAGFEVAAMNAVRTDGSTEVVSIAGEPTACRGVLGSIQSSQFWDSMNAASILMGRLRYVDGAVTRSFSAQDCRIRVEEHPQPDSADDVWRSTDFLYAPLHDSTNRWLGMLTVDKPVHGRMPGPEQREILELFADHAALAIEHAQLHDAIVRSESKARYEATHDPLTGLWNRARLMEELDKAVCEGPTAVLVIDLDEFKAVNDRLGHLNGDRVLEVVAKRILSCTADSDVTIRTGGDEFVVLVFGTDSAERARSLADKVAVSISVPIELGVSRCVVGSAIGSAYTRGGTEWHTLLAQADADMYYRKRHR